MSADLQQYTVNLINIYHQLLKVTFSTVDPERRIAKFPHISKECRTEITVMALRVYIMR